MVVLLSRDNIFPFRARDALTLIHAQRNCGYPRLILSMNCSRARVDALAQVSFNSLAASQAAVSAARLAESSGDKGRLSR